MTDRRSELWTDAGLLLVTVIWGVNFPVVKVALEALPPLAFNALRFPLAALVLFVLLRARGPLRRPRREDVPRIVGLGLLGNVLYQLLFIYGLDGTLSGNAAILLATVPVWTVVLSTLRGHERPDVTVWIGVLLTVAGMLALVLGGRAAVAVGGATLRGDLLSVAAAVAWSVYTVEGREVVARYGSLQVTAWTLWIGAVFLVLLGLPALFGTALGSVPAIAWGGVLYAGTLAVGIAYLLWYWAVRRIGSSRTAVFGNFVPVIALLVAWMWLGERPSSLQLVGAGVVLGGMTLTRLRRRKLRPDPTGGTPGSSPGA